MKLATTRQRSGTEQSKAPDTLGSHGSLWSSAFGLLSLLRRGSTKASWFETAFMIDQTFEYGLQLLIVVSVCLTSEPLSAAPTGCD